MSNTLNLAATCLFGLEGLLGEEIDALGGKRTETIDGRVYFTADAQDIAKFNIGLRFAQRVLINLGSFTAYSFTDLFDGTAALPWENFIGKEDAFPVKGHSIRSKLTSIPDCQSIIKKAVVERLKKSYRVDWFRETGVKYQIEFFILNDKATLMIDTSGVPLHKRGYRKLATEAPIRETLAAALVKLSRPREDVILWDPFCGSGTIAIEAASMVTNTAPGLHRAFAAEQFSFLNKRIWDDARNEALANIKTDCTFTAYASDIDPKCIDLAKKVARDSGLSKHIKFFVKDALTIQKTDERVTIVCNPPYGERLDTISGARQLYRNMGKVFLQLSPWQIYIITSEEEFERLYGKRADKVRKLYNGMIKCNYYQYFKREK